jgi:hypothetical protein
MARRKSPKPIPQFRTEAEEREFWLAHDLTDFAEFSQARIGEFPNLKLSTETISLRLPAGLLAELKILANQHDVPDQLLLKVFLSERIAKERLLAGGRAPRKRLRRSGAKPRGPGAARAKGAPAANSGKPGRRGARRGIARRSGA